MKALSVKQPYACAIADGLKNLEFRSRPTNYRGDILICSSKSEKSYTTEDGMPLPIGKAMVVVNLINCRQMSADDLAEFGAPSSIDGWWVLEFEDGVGETVEPIEVKGSLSFFDVENEKIIPIPDGMTWEDF